MARETHGRRLEDLVLEGSIGNPCGRNYNAVKADKKLQGCEWIKVILVTGGSYGTGLSGSPGHIYTCYLFPPGENKLWAYDLYGSQRVRAYKDDPDMIARNIYPPAAHGEWIDDL